MTDKERKEALLNELELLENCEEQALSVSDDVHLESISLKRREIQAELDILIGKEGQ